ncbi:UDP-N-acetylmuramoyl-L-alanyl-D-glutamate--2,6-diaminopimelate ligase [Rubellicoccus peritrichatus]|uniref:UDP-N-acetylmuramoyl-L-alanyl-D-glutamate--2,6-diaminopimelate ligase n=1 Tax=Rubellicoccus peritrichatus TaxID=3080537 RepID=A0AAQ3QXY9_9BACT|nr:UDP-N-acetylmuramoyl-L-alanyl-D-glutamate--2,6-diaminopimelate ligase [Puniceicoccus sp. CR14]WOO43547.1 UDP-N-acetylmuramoyl-L-alanyl-D-glutamate--2,6-diaminopimelate ligase [Puniceicoccus sp. CR14]
MIGLSCLENSLSWSAALSMRFAASMDAGDASEHTMPTVKALTAGLPNASLSGGGKQEVTCLITDSRRVVPGALFFAIGGLHTDGNLYIEEAIGRGAVGIVSEQPAGSNRQVAWLQVPNVRSVLAEVARRFYDHPDTQVEVVGVTGTNGKTTVSMLLQFLLSEQPADTGLIGTVRYDLGRRTIPSYKTTPESVDIYSMLDQMRREQCKRAVMEISSHAIDQQRVEGLHVRIAAFLNLTRDHIDYHHDLDAYFSVKAKLFTGETGNLPEVAVVNLDDPYGHRLLKKIPANVRTITFGKDDSADIRAENIRLEPEGSRFRAIWPGGEAELFTREPGQYNVSNVLAALAVCYARGMDLTALSEKIASFPGVPGRMERVDLGQPFPVLVDYAHTDDALRNALGMLREITPGRLFVVFGCGGNRDREKRPLMTTAVQEKADFTWATSDNPRKETIEQIFDDMRSGVVRDDAIDFVSDRRRAIGLAIDAAGEGDCVIIAGKGHETFQEFADTVVPFDDRLVARDFLSRKNFQPKEDAE